MAAARVWKKKGLYGLGYGREGERRGAIIVGGSVWCDCVKGGGEEIYESIGKWFFMWEITRCGGH